MKKPTVLRVKLENIPPELRRLRNWVGWRYEWQDDKWDKVPIDPHTGGRAKVNDPSTWGTLEEACRVGGDGVGLVLTARLGLVAVDLDRCHDMTTAQIDGWAWDIVREVNSYTELSASGTGLRILATGSLRTGAGRKNGPVEVYAAQRFLTITGWRLRDSPADVGSREEELHRLEERVVAGQGALAGPARFCEEAGLTDEQVLGRARACSGEKFERLWAGDTSGYHSHSEADLALMSILAFWTQHDPGRMERLFGQSGLALRKKWQRRDDYREDTIKRAMLTRGTKSIQEYSGQTKNSHTAVMKAHHGREVAGEGVSAVQVKDERGEGDGQKLALDLAGSQKGRPVRKASFALARRLRQLADRPEQFEGAVRAFCEQSGHDPEEMWYAFLACWKKVRLAEGDSALHWALGMAEKDPAVPSASLWRTYALVASIAKHLAGHTHPEPFFLPCKQLASLLNCSVMTISRVIALLEENKVIKCVMEDYSFTEKKAKEYAYTAERPEGEQIR